MSEPIDEPGPDAPTAAPEPPSSKGSLGLEHPIVRAMAPLAGLALVSLLTGRVLAPAMAGVGVGMDELVYGMGRLGAITSQIFAFAGMMTVIVAILAASRSNLPVTVRIASLTLGGFAVLPTVWALHQPVPELSAALVAASASLLALVAAPTALRVPFARAPGMVLGFVALGGLVRLGAVGLAFQAAEPHSGVSAALVRGIATVAFFCDAAAVIVALVWVGARRNRLTSPGTLATLAVAVFCTRQALAGQGSDAHGLDLLFWRAASRLLSLPGPALPLGLQIFVSFLAPLLAVAALLSRRILAPLGAGVALALAARGAVEMPPCGLMLMIGALGTAFTARDGRALWESIARSAPNAT